MQFSVKIMPNNRSVSPKVGTTLINSGSATNHNNDVDYVYWVDKNVVSFFGRGIWEFPPLYDFPCILGVISGWKFSYTPEKRSTTYIVQKPLDLSFLYTYPSAPISVRQLTNKGRKYHVWHEDHLQQKNVQDVFYIFIVNGSSVLYSFIVHYSLLWL